jgi:hypothetical protein
MAPSADVGALGDLRDHLVRSEEGGTISPVFLCANGQAECDDVHHRGASPSLASTEPGAGTAHFFRQNRTPFSIITLMNVSGKEFI